MTKRTKILTDKPSFFPGQPMFFGQFINALPLGPTSAPSANASINGYYCQCGRKYVLKAALDWHIKWECGGKLKCSNCGKTYKNLQNYRNHVKLKCL